MCFIYIHKNIYKDIYAYVYVYQDIYMHIYLSMDHKKEPKNIYSRLLKVKVTQSCPTL